MVNYQAVGTFISKLRKTKGLTQMEFAECLNVTHQTVSKWENGITLPDTETLFALSKQFKVKVDDILKVILADLCIIQNLAITLRIINAV